MSCKKNLLICSTDEELKQIKKHIADNYCIATQNYHFFLKCKNNGEMVNFLESDKGIEYREVCKIIDNINDIIKGCVKKEYLYTFSSYPIWPFANHLGRILWYINVIEEIVVKNEINTIYMLDNAMNWVFNEAAFLLAYNSGIQYYIIDERDGTEKECLFTLKDSLYDQNRKKQVLKNALQIEKFIEYYKRERKEKKRKREEYEVGVLAIVKEQVRYVEAIMARVEALKNNFSVNVIAVYNAGGADEIRNRGVNCDCIENYFSRMDYVWLYLQYIVNVYRVMNALRKKMHIKYKEIDLTPYMLKKVMNRLQRENLERVYIDSCMKGYFRCCKYALIECMTETSGFEVRIAYQNVKKYGSKLFFATRVSPFYYYRKEANANEIAVRVFPNKKVEERELGNIDYNGAIYYAQSEFMVKGVGKMSEVKNLKKGKSTILFLPQPPTVGLVSVRKYFQICEDILNALTKTDYKVIVKNHPGMDNEIESKLIQEFNDTSNIRFVPSDDSVYKYLEECDIVIASSISLALWDAVEAQRPVFGMKWHENKEIDTTLMDEFLIYDDAEKMCDDILAIVNDSEGGKTKLDTIVEKHNLCLRELRGDPDSYKRNLCKILRTELE
ncbi:MAG: hypothetical protein IJO65_00370 [Lachnospiraceae bacterium]|nr:hypothetical protein [Lachnospiraceae bacterium]